MDGFILAGGSSTRIWEYKAKLVLEEVRFIYRAVKAVSGGERQRVVIIGGNIVRYERFCRTSREPGPYPSYDFTSNPLSSGTANSTKEEEIKPGPCSRNAR
jgi:CTP:molybdopterin cytidylyltransferase MocA